MVTSDPAPASDPTRASDHTHTTGASEGFDELFLGPSCPLPARADAAAGRSIRRLDYTHFSVLLDTGRRLAALTGVNIDGRLLRDVPRGDDWHLDPRVPAEEQAGPELYSRNDLDRGHLVRRRDPVWGTDAVAARAEYDTFAYTNAAPQAAAFNQSKELWNGLEDHVLAYAEAYRLRLDVFTGAVFADDDRLYRGVQLPKRFWKIAAWYDTGRERLAAAGFLLDQSNELDRIDLRSAQATDAPPPLPGFRTFQVPIADIARDTGFDLTQLVAADVFLAPLRAAGRRWTTLDDPGQIRL
ncbi:DNA/RNA non-specific endonuclease [Herbiconiux sp. KACC 21604]|uniref:DNA/RNA non-specific endonuclease n=1 Tax=unclassified Herbiconiux TaxID=2618217 RepID=UPI00149209A0|nr:DNA/RNA non-specific endonuclease [Herbiconiux sp. SALV-R1]QJU52310.1 DNA/RNA non-specific endonuclease [Herbiconiux sp. SALV-R1]WPO87158.1 DNA/RNA non-specific endonuclease [Herbiconiux sp. KACC 21604]